MNKAICITLIYFAFALALKAQNKTYTKSDFYGTWVLDLNEFELDDDIYTFEREKSSKNQEEKLNIIVTLLESGQCKVNYDRTSGFCGNEAFKDYSWLLDKDLGTINIYHSEIFLKQFKEENPEDFNSFGLPEKYNSMELKIVTLNNGGIGLEITDWE